MEIELYKAYSSRYDNIEFPIYQLSDQSYLCISYSCNHKCYNLNIYTEKDFVEQGYQREEYNDYIFENITKYDIGIFSSYVD